jgi:transposase-like protein
MATSLSAAHRVPHTAKQPDHCPHCGSSRLIRKGTHRKKLEIAQLWQCKLCRRVFTPAPPALRYKSYPLRLILDGVTLFNIGYSVAEAAKKLQEKHGYKIPPATLETWMAEHRDLTTYRRLRGRAPIRLKPAQTIRSSKLYHRQVTASLTIGRNWRSFGWNRATADSLRSPIFWSKCQAFARIISFKTAHAHRSCTISSTAITSSSPRKKITPPEWPPWSSRR